MIKPFSVLIVAALGVAPAHATDVVPSVESAQQPAAVASSTAPLRETKAKGRMPIRGIDHLVMVYGSAATPDDARPLVADQDACNLFPRHRI